MHLSVFVYFCLPDVNAINEKGRETPPFKHVQRSKA